MRSWFLGVALLSLAPTAVAAEVETGTAAARDGLEIAYDVRGAGSTALVFVHCWACDREFWREQLDVFAGDYRVVSLDLPGHGASGAERDAWSIAGLGADVQAVVEALDLKRVVLIGHSMGGPVTLAAAALLPERVIGVVCVDTVHDAENRMPPGMAEQLAAQFEQDWEGSMRQMVPAMFPPTADPAVRDWVAEQALGTDRAAAVALMRAFEDVDLPALLSGAGVPVRGVNAYPLPPVIPETKIETNRKYADYDAALIQGVGHYLQLEKPEEFNAALRAALTAIEAAE
jgi:pimeloyl-ACP methyl ester carboxylesterase